MKEWIKSLLKKWKERRRKEVEQGIRQDAERIYNIKATGDGKIFLVLDIGRGYRISDDYESYGEATQLLVTLREKFYQEQIKRLYDE